jgi:hypothetical protein
MRVNRGHVLRELIPISCGGQASVRWFPGPWRPAPGGGTVPRASRSFLLSVAPRLGAWALRFDGSGHVQRQ